MAQDGAGGVPGPGQSGNGRDVVEIDLVEETNNNVSQADEAGEVPVPAVAPVIKVVNDGLPPIGDPGNGHVNRSTCYLYTYNYFKKSEDLNTATCRLCKFENETKKTKLKTEFKTTNQGTTGIWTHFECKHPVDYKLVKELEAKHEKEAAEIKAKKNGGDGMKQQKLVSINQQVMVELPPEIDKETQARWDEAVMMFCAETMCSFSICEKLVILLKAIWPHGRWKVRVKDRTTISRQITTMAKEYYQDIRDIVYSIKDLGGLGATSDIWKNKANYSFMCMTMHIITQEWELIKFVPHVTYFGPIRHTGENIRDWMLLFLDKLGLKERNLKVYLTMDTAKNNKKAQRLMTNVEDVWCIIHVAMLCIGDVLKLTVGRTKINRIFDKCNDLANAIRNKERMENQLKQACVETETSYIRVIQPNKTRFNSKEANLESCRRLKKPLQHLLNSDITGDWEELILTPVEWDLADCLLETLHVVKIATKKWELDTEPSLHHAITELYNIHEKMDEMKVGTNNNIKVFATRLQKAFDTRLPSCGTTNPLYRLAHLLDPNSKGIILQEFGCFDETVSELKVLCKKYAKPTGETAERERVAAPDPEENPDEDKNLTALQKLKKRKLNSGEAVSVPINATSLDVQINEEIQMFLNLDVVESEAREILPWYKARCGTFKFMAPVVREIFSIPVSSSSSERAFSIGTQVCVPKRANLAPAKIEQLIMIKLNAEKLKSYKATHKIERAVPIPASGAGGGDSNVDVAVVEGIDNQFEDSDDEEDDGQLINDNEECVMEELEEFINSAEDDYGDMPPLIPQQR